MTKNDASCLDDLKKGGAKGKSLAREIECRRTFIVNALSMGITPNVVMKWTGHSDYKAMKPYIDIVDSIKASSMAKFDGLI